MAFIVKGFLFGVLCIFLTTNASARDMQVMTFNLRVPVDPPPYDWGSRKPRVIAAIKNQAPDFLGVQEATPELVADLKQALPDYAVFGRGRNEDGGGEGTQIFYRKDHWVADKNDQGTLQLSPTPTVVGSNGWAMQWPRIFTWVRLREKGGSKAVYIFNTHFPLQPQERDLSVRLLAASMAERKHKNDPVILTGDFNACEDEAAIKYLLGQEASPIAMTDSYRAIHPGVVASSFHGFGKVESCRIDYIFVAGKLDTKAAEIIKDTGDFASDHYAVTARFGFKD